MFSRLVIKSVLAICLITALVASVAKAQTETKILSMEELLELPSSTFEILKSRDYSNVDKMDLILQRLRETETSLHQLIITRQVIPADIPNPSSDSAKAFRVADTFSILAELQLKNGEFTENSCAEAKGMLSISAMESPAEGGEVNMDRRQHKLSSILKLLCR